MQGLTTFFNSDHPRLLEDAPKMFAVKATSSLCRQIHVRTLTGVNSRKLQFRVALNGDQALARVHPPSAVIDDPVMLPAASDARNAIRRPISSGSPKRPIGMSRR